MATAPRQAPYGYSLDKAAHKIVVHEGEAAVVRQIFDWVEQGRSVRSIMLELRRQGVTTRRGSPWAISSVGYILKCRAYIGEGHFNKRGWTKQTDGRRVDHAKPEAEWISFTLPAIVAPEVFARVQRQLTRNREVVVGRRSTNRVYLLRGLLRCGVCSSRYSGAVSKGKLTYRCNNHRSGVHHCTAPQLQADSVEGQVWGAIVNVIRHPDALRQDVEHRAARQGAQDAVVRSAVDHVKRQLADVQRRERRLLDLYMAEDKAAPDAVRGKMDEMMAERRGLETRLREAEKLAAQEGAQELQLAAVAAWCAKARRGIDKLDRAGRQQLLRDTVDRVVVRGDTLEVETSFAQVRPVLASPAESAAVEANVQCSLASW